MNKTKIEWCDFTWNPVVGCKHGCSYCYARRINNRFHYIESWENPVFFEDRLFEPYSLNRPSIIFVCSMSDLFGAWVPSYWPNIILDVVRENPQHRFMFLTKNPNRYKELPVENSFPVNAWLGVTINSNANKQRINELKDLPKSIKKYVSIEPLLGMCDDLDLSCLDLVIVGAMTGPGALMPKIKWIQSIKCDQIFWKGNIKTYLKQIEHENNNIF
jgi:protein gp37